MLQTFNVVRNQTLVSNQAFPKTSIKKNINSRKMSTLHIPSVWDIKPYKRISTMQTMPIRAVQKNSYTQIRDQILSEIPMVSSVWSAYMSLTTVIKIFSVMYDEFLPIELRRYIIGQAVKHFSKPKLTLILDEEDGSSPNDMFKAAEVYLCSKFSPDSDRLR